MPHLIPPKLQNDLLKPTKQRAFRGFRFHTVGLGEPWRGFATKFLAYERTLRRLLDTTLQPEDLVMLLDAWDTVILAPADELRAKLSAIPAKTILGGTECVCGPNHFLVAQMEALYPDGTTPWRYPNSGGLVGPAETMADLLDGLIHDTDGAGSLPAEENDQVRLHDFLIARAARGSRYPFVLDTQCSVFQCMYEEQPQWDVIYDSDTSPPKPRIENRQTLQRPVVAHGNGHTGRWFLSALYSEMKLLDHLGLRMEELQHLQHEMPVPPGTEVTEEIKAEYCPWWYMPGVHKGATDGFATFRMIREMQCGPASQR
ncbi:PLOD3 [Symbiodinium sp. CCMP2592]|nr:PLOD3 [Symbiodinium sp. CCMP2592]